MLRQAWVVGLLGTLMGTSALAADMVVYKSPFCGCCKQWVHHLEENGFSVETRNEADMAAIKQQLGVPKAMESCHTAVIQGYLVEGHVPAADIKRLLAEKPAVKGLAVPGMPVGSPGMEVPGRKADAFNSVTFSDKGESKVFAAH